MKWTGRRAVGLLLVLGLTACTGPLGTTRAGGGARDEAAGQAEFEEALLAYADCMRDNGVDYPDPDFSGEPVIVDDQQPGFADAEQACEGLDPEALFATTDGAAAQREMMDWLLEQTRCLRDLGYTDVPDPALVDGEPTQYLTGIPEDEADEALATCEERVPFPGARP